MVSCSVRLAVAVRYPAGVARFTEVRADHLKPRPDRFDPSAPGYAASMRAHDAAVRAGQGGYLDPSSGLFVMTASGLAERGYCCDNGCRHCPFGDA